MDMNIGCRRVSGGRRAGLLIGFGAAASIVAGCAGDRPTTAPTYRNPNAWDFAQGVMDRGPMLVEVRGQPYATDKAAIDGAITRAMERAITWSSGARFTTNAEEASSQSFRVVTTFNGPVGLGSNENCQSGAGGEPLPDGSVRLLTTFCDGAEVISNVGGAVGPTTGVADPKFSALIQQSTRDLFPRTGLQPRGIGIGVGIGGGSGGGGGGVGWGIGF